MDFYMNNNEGLGQQVRCKFCHTTFSIWSAHPMAIVPNSGGKPCSARGFTYEEVAMVGQQEMAFEIVRGEW